MELFLDVRQIRLTVLVGTHKVKRREQDALHSPLLKIVLHHVGAHNLALRHHALLFETGEDILGEAAQIVELGLEKVACALLVLWCGIEFVDMGEILLLQAIGNLIGSVGILLIEVVCDFDKLVRRTRHGREHHHGGFARGRDEVTDVLHPLG